jgi:phospholipid transport system transporter-binding protein
MRPRLPASRKRSNKARHAMIELSDGRYRVQGPVTMSTVPALLRETRNSFEGTEIRVDLAGVTEVDSAGVALLLAWTRAASQAAKRIRFEHVSENLKTLIQLYDVADLLPVA